MNTIGIMVMKLMEADMWKLLKAEIIYNKFLLTVMFASSLVIFSLVWILEDLHIQGFMRVTMMIYFIFMGIIGGRGVSGEKRHRLFSLLPCSPLEIGMQRLLFIHVVFCGILVLWALFFAVQSNDPSVKSFWNIMAHVALIPGAIMAFVVSHDLGFLSIKMNRFLFLSISRLPVFAGLGLIWVLIFNVFYGFLDITPFKAVLVTAFWLGLSFISVFLFVRRSSYLA